MADEHPELLPQLKYPPNVFDRFVLAAHHEALQRAEVAEARLAELEGRLAVAEGHAAAAGERAATAEAQAVEAQRRAALAEGHAASAGERAATAEAQAVEAQRRAIEAEARADALEGHLQNVYNSKSWRLTRPLRWLKAPLAAEPQRD
ncbi:hypothetical protein D3C78_1409130 [compost metagenome]